MVNNEQYNLHQINIPNEFCLKLKINMIENFDALESYNLNNDMLELFGQLRILCDAQLICYLLYKY